MSWVAAAVAGGAILGAVQGNQQRQAEQRANQQNADISAAQAQYSPWTGIKPQNAQMGAVGASALGGAEKGALTGAMYSSAIGKANAAAGADKAAQGDQLTKEFDAMPDQAQGSGQMPQPGTNEYFQWMQKRGYGPNQA